MAVFAGADGRMSVVLFLDTPLPLDGHDTSCPSALGILEPGQNAIVQVRKDGRPGSNLSSFRTNVLLTGTIKNTFSVLRIIHDCVLCLGYP